VTICIQLCIALASLVLKTSCVVAHFSFASVGLKVALFHELSDLFSPSQDTTVAPVLAAAVVSNCAADVITYPLCTWHRYHQLRQLEPALAALNRSSVDAPHFPKRRWHVRDLYRGLSWSVARHVSLASLTVALYPQFERSWYPTW